MKMLNDVVWEFSHYCYNTSRWEIQRVSSGKDWKDAEFRGTEKFKGEKTT